MSAERGNVAVRHDWTIAQAAAAMATGQVSSSEILEECLGRAEAGDAFVELDAEGARARAAVLDTELEAVGARTPLHGIPIAVKDIVDVRGMHTRANSRILLDNVAADDAPIVARLRAAGANVLGKVATHEFAYGVVTPGCRNPWDSGRIAGGSSGGSAVAVATGGALGAVGTDTAGSIRIPASLCGVCGLRPRRGRLPMDGIIATAPTLDVCGPMARSAEDLALCWEALCGRALPRGSRSSLRLGVPVSLEAATQADAGVCDAVRDAVEIMEAAGATVSPVELPSFADWDRWRWIPQMVEALAVHRAAGWYPAHSGEYTDETLASLRVAETLAGDYDEAGRHLVALSAALRDAIRDVDILVLPTTPTVAPSLAEAARVEPGTLRRPIVTHLTRLVGPIGWADLAAVSVPCGLVEGLPVGLQLIARDEAEALVAAVGYQERTPFHRARP